MRHAVQIKRAYEPPSPQDGRRILVDRIWPRGLKKADAAVDAWMKDVAPSAALRKWFGHRPERWDEFRRRYSAELREGPAAAALRDLAEATKRERVTLVYGARDAQHNQAVVLADILEARA